MSERIRLSEDTYRALVALKGNDETFDDLLSRLLAERRESDARAFGTARDSGRELTRQRRHARRARRRNGTSVAGDVYDSGVLVEYLADDDFRVEGIADVLELDVL